MHVYTGGKSPYFYVSQQKKERLENNRYFGTCEQVNKVLGLCCAKLQICIKIFL